MIAYHTAVSSELSTGDEILGFGYQMQPVGVKAAVASLGYLSDDGTQIWQWLVD